MLIEAEMMQWAHAVLLDRTIDQPEAQKLAGILDTIEELLPWALYKQGGADRFPDVTDALTRSARKASLSGTPRTAATANSGQLLAQAKSVESAMGELVRENIADQQKARAVDRAISALVRNCPTGSGRDVLYRAVLPD